MVILVLRAFNHELKYLANENVDLMMTLDEKSEDRQSYYNLRGTGMSEPDFKSILLIFHVFNS